MISVLYVDDEPALLQIGKRFLERAGEFSVETATSAKAALSSPAIRSYDAIIADYQMPGMDGIEFLKAVRAAGSNTPFILFTGRGREEVVIEAINNGADFYLQKGGDPKAQFAELAHKIQQAVRRRSAEENLEKSKERYRTIVNDLSEMIVRFDPEGIITFSNPAHTGFLLNWRGVENCVGKNFRELLGPEKYRAELGRTIALLTPDRPYHSQEITETWDDGTTHWYHWAIRAFFLPDGSVAEYQVVGHDITGVKTNEVELRAAYEELIASDKKLRSQFADLAKNQAALKKSEEMFRDIVETSLDLIWEIDADGTITYMSPSCTGTLGYSREEMVGRTVFSLVPEKELPAFRELFTMGIRTVKQKNEFNLPLRCRDGRVLTLEIRSIPRFDTDGRFIGFRGTARDITEKHKALRALAENEEKFRTLVENSLDGILITGLDGLLLFANRAAGRILDCPDPSRIIGKNVRDYIAPASKDAVMNDIAEVAQGHEAFYVTYQIVTEKRRAIWVECVGKKVSFEGTAAILVSMRDMTERKLAEEQVRESEIKFSTVFQSSPVPLTLVSAKEGKFVDSNDAFLTNTGYSRDELIGKRAEDLGIFADSDKYEHFVSTLREQRMVHGMELRCRNKDGEIRACRFSSGIILVGGTPHILSTVEDITERKQVEEALHQSEEKFRALVEHSLGAILILDPGGIILFANHAAGQIIEHENFNDLVGIKNVMEFIAPESQADVIKDFSTVASGVDGYPAEYKLATASRRERWVESVGKTITFDGAPAILISIRDVTERIATQSALKAIIGSMVRTTGLDSLWKIAQNVSSWLRADCVMVGEIQPDHDTVKVLSMILDGKEVNDFIYHLKGTPCENVAEKGFCHYPDDAIRLFPESKDLALLNIRGYVGTPLKNSDGNVIGILCALFRNPFQSSPAVQEIMQIIAVKAGSEIERSQIERALKESEEKFRSIVETSPDMIWETDQQGNFRYISPMVKAILGYSPEEVIGRSILYFVPEEKRSAAMQELMQMISSEGELSSIEFAARHRNGSDIILEIHPARLTGTDGRLPGLRGVAVDITQRKRAEEELQKSEETFRSFVENANEIIFSLAPGGIFTYVSPNWAEWLGHDTREVIGRYAAEFVHPDDYPKTREVFLQTFATGERAGGTEFRMRHKDGVWQWYSQSISPIRDTKGTIIGIQGICHNITDRKQAEDELKKSQYLLSEALDMARMADWEFDALTGIFTFNDQFYALYGTTAEREGGYQMPAEVYAREFTHPDDRAIVDEEIKNALSSRHPGNFSTREHRIIRRDGEVRWIVVRIRVDKDAEGRTIRTHGANQDITDRKKAEEALRQANNKLNLLSSISRHDIRNQLLALNGFVSLLQEDVGDARHDEFFSRITEASTNIADMIQFAKEYEMIGAGALVWQDVQTVIAVAGKGIIPGQVSLENELPAGTELFSDPMLEKVFFNLLDNAVRHGEHVTQIRVSSRPSGEDLVIVWEDNGVGIPADDKELIFERGFGRNTGLGMFLVREILSLTGISIAENGEPGRGARFEITVPKGAYRIRS